MEKIASNPVTSVAVMVFSALNMWQFSFFPFSIRLTPSKFPLEFPPEFPSVQFVSVFLWVELSQVGWEAGAACGFLSNCKVSGESSFGADASMLQNHWKA